MFKSFLYLILKFHLFQRHLIQLYFLFSSPYMFPGITIFISSSFYDSSHTVRHIGYNFVGDVLSIVVVSVSQLLFTFFHNQTGLPANAKAKETYLQTPRLWHFGKRRQFLWLLKFSVFSACLCDAQAFWRRHPDTTVLGNQVWWKIWVLNSLKTCKLKVKKDYNQVKKKWVKDHRKNGRMYIYVNYCQENYPRRGSQITKLKTHVVRKWWKVLIDQSIQRILFENG